MRNLFIALTLIALIGLGTTVTLAAFQMQAVTYVSVQNGSVVPLTFTSISDANGDTGVVSGAGETATLGSAASPINLTVGESTSLYLYIHNSNGVAETLALNIQNNASIEIVSPALTNNLTVPAYTSSLFTYIISPLSAGSDTIVITLSAP